MSHSFNSPIPPRSNQAQREPLERAGLPCNTSTKHSSFWWPGDLLAHTWVGCMPSVQRRNCCIDCIDSSIHTSHPKMIPEVDVLLIQNEGVLLIQESTLFDSLGYLGLVPHYLTVPTVSAKMVRLACLQRPSCSTSFGFGPQPPGPGGPPQPPGPGGGPPQPSGPGGPPQPPGPGGGPCGPPQSMATCDTELFFGAKLGPKPKHATAEIDLETTQEEQWMQMAKWI